MHAALPAALIHWQTHRAAWIVCRCHAVQRCHLDHLPSHASRQKAASLGCGCAHHAVTVLHPAAVIAALHCQQTRRHLSIVAAAQTVRLARPHHTCSERHCLQRLAQETAQQRQHACAVLADSALMPRCLAPPFQSGPQPAHSQEGCPQGLTHPSRLHAERRWAAASAALWRW